MFALDDWTKRSLQDVLPAGAQFAWDGGMRVLVEWREMGRANPQFEPALVLRFNRDVVAIIGQGVSRLSNLIVDRARSLIRSRLGVCQEDNTAVIPVVVELDLHTLGFD